MKRKKHVKIFTLVVALVLLSGLSSVSANENISVYLDGIPLSFDVPPMTQNGRTLVPMRTIFEGLGATVSWNENTQTATASKYGMNVYITIGSSNMRCVSEFSGEEILPLDVPATVINGRTLIPLRAVSEAFWCQVGWDETDKTISIIDDNFDMTMLYAPGGRSRSFPNRMVCEQLESGWFDNQDLIQWEYGPHSDLSSNLICKRCGQYVAPNLNMTTDERSKAKAVQYISNREFWHDDTNERFVLTFSLLDSTQTTEIAVPAVVQMWIVNDNDECVYDITTTVSTSDFGYWTKQMTGVQTYRCAVYIYDWMIDYGTCKTGKMYFSVYNEGYFGFDPSTLNIDGKLPLKESYVELPVLPNVISEYTYDNKLSSSYKITDIVYEIDGENLTLYFSGEKIYDKEGNKYSQSCKIGWKLYDSEGYVVDSGTLYTPNISVGEKFRNEHSTAYGCIKPGDTYILKILDVD